jgi:hypothetical protein
MSEKKQMILPRSSGHSAKRVISKTEVNKFGYWRRGKDCG